MPTVARISVTPVRTFRLDHLEEVELTERGGVENRRFMLVDAGGKRLRSSLTVRFRCGSSRGRGRSCCRGCTGLRCGSSGPRRLASSRRRR